MAKKLQFFVAGLGRFGISVAVTLEKMGYDVMAMDIDEEVVQIFQIHWATWSVRTVPMRRTWQPSVPAMQTSLSFLSAICRQA